MGNAFRDVLQGASNAAASNVSGPVDGIAWLLRKAGIPVPQNALGGSQWMAQQGLTAQPQNELAGMAGETAGLLAPFAAAAKAPQIANALGTAAENYVASQAAGRMPNAAQRGATVWHGSPHKFDKFDASKIGTGEGSQAYGHGSYLAESPEVSRSYSVIAQKPGLRQGTAVGSDGGVVDALIMLNAKKYTGGDVGKLAELVKRQPGAFAKPDEMISRMADFVDNQPPAFMYKVDLPDEHIARMLDWDKPLSQQAPGVQTAFSKLGLDGNATGQEAYRAAHEAAIRAGKAQPAAEKERQAVEALRRAGVPGLRYLDGGSRGAGNGTSNYVVFPGNENLLNILERNGQPIR